MLDFLLQIFFRGFPKFREEFRYKKFNFYFSLENKVLATSRATVNQNQQHFHPVRNIVHVVLTLKNQELESRFLHMIKKYFQIKIIVELGWLKIYFKLCVKFTRFAISFYFYFCFYFNFTETAKFS